MHLRNAKTATVAKSSIPVIKSKLVNNLHSANALLLIVLKFVAPDKSKVVNLSQKLNA